MADPVADRLADMLLDDRRTKLPLDAVKEAFFVAAPAALGAADWREQLSMALTALADVGVVQWSRRRSPGLPELPSQVTVAADRPTGASRRDAVHSTVWRGELSFVLRLNPPPSQRLLADLTAINAFLRDHGPRAPMIAVRERSIRLFGDDKRLEALASTDVFATNRLSYQLLRCYPVTPPLAWCATGPGPGCLVVENHTPYDSVRRALAEDPGDIGAVVFGAGNQLPTAMQSLAAIVHHLQRRRSSNGDLAKVHLRYFGDLDVAGLRIATAAADRAVDLGLPPLEPATPLYQKLLEHAQPARGDAVKKDVAEHLAAWLPEALRPQAVRLLVDGRRAVQEWVNVDLLSMGSEWRRLANS